MTAEQKVFTENEMKRNIEELFHKIWPQMEGRAISEGNCFKNIDAIVNRFNKHHLDLDNLLISLSSLEGLGLVISSGLIFVAYKDLAVPFDKYTMGYAIWNKILLTPKISDGNCSTACSKVRDYISHHPTINSIHEFVLAAGSLESWSAVSPL